MPFGMRLDPVCLQWNAEALHLRLLKRRCAVDPTSTLVMQHLQWVGTSVLRRAVVKEVNLCFYTEPPALAYRQPIMSMRSDVEPSALLQHLGRRTAIVVRSSVWPLEALQLSHPPMRRVKLHFQIEHKLALIASSCRQQYLHSNWLVFLHTKKTPHH